MIHRYFSDVVSYRDSVQFLYATTYDGIFIEAHTIGSFLCNCIPESTEHTLNALVLIQFERHTVLVLTFMCMLELSTCARLAKRLLVFVLITTGKSFVSLIRNNCELVDDFIVRRTFCIIDTLTLLVHADTKTSAYFLTFLVL